MTQPAALASFSPSPQPTAVAFQAMAVKPIKGKRANFSFL